MIRVQISAMKDGAGICESLPDCTMAQDRLR